MELFGFGMTLLRQFILRCKQQAEDLNRSALYAERNLRETSTAALLQALGVMLPHHGVH